MAGDQPAIWARRTSYGSLEMDEPVRQPKFGESWMSILDVLVTSADSLPLELPVAQFLEETCSGMRGAQTEDSDSRDSTEQRVRWKSLRDTLSSEASRTICNSLFWVVLGILFGTVSEEGDRDLRDRLARSWLNLSVKLNKHNGDRATPGELARRAWLGNMLPVALVQTVFRLLVDCFPFEHEKLMRSTDIILEKLNQIAYRELSGFHICQETSRTLRKKLFFQNVIDHPSANQKESAKKDMGREKQSRRKRQAQSQPMSFGEEDTLPLEEMQLEHILEQRERDKNRACSRKDRGDGETSPKPRKKDSWDMQFSGFLPVGAEMLSVDRYVNIRSEGEELMMRQFAELYPEEQEDPTDSESSFQTSRKAGSSNPNSRPASRPAGLGKTRQVFVTTAHTTAQGDVANATGRSTKHAKRDAEAAERRRRDELFAERIARPLPEALGLTTVHVSPLVDRLAPSDGQCGLLHKPSSEGRKLRMRHTSPVFRNFLPPLSRSQSEPSCDALETEARRSQSDFGAGRTAKGSDAASRDKKAHEGGCPIKFSSAKNQVPVKNQSRSETILIEPPTSVKSEVVLGRLHKQAEASRHQSFDEYKRLYDMTTGQKKIASDPRQLEAEERLYIKKVEALVGKASSRAPRMLKQNAYSLNKSRSQVS